MADVQTAVNGLGEPCALPRLFTTWMTSLVDKLDHAVTDEEFGEHRPEPDAVCGDVVRLAPLTHPNGLCCPRCVAYLAAYATVRDLGGREEQQSCHSAGLSWLRHVRNFHPIRWFGKRLPWSRSQTGQPSQVLNARAAESLVPAQRGQSQTPVAVAARWPLTAAAAGPFPTPATDALRGAPVPGVVPPSTAVECVSGSRLAVPSRSAGGARHALGRDGHQLLVPSLAAPQGRDDQVPKASTVPARVDAHGQSAKAAGAAPPDAALAVPNTPADPR